VLWSGSGQPAETELLLVVEKTPLCDCRVSLVAVAALAVPASAHQSFAVYDADTVVTLTGTVTRFDWTNPHVYVFVDIDDEDGEAVEWALEGESTALLSRAGWSRTTLAPGDRISARVYRNRNPEQHEARILTLVTPDGATLGRRTTSTALPSVGARDLAGVWDALRDYGEYEFVRGALTEQGRPPSALSTRAGAPCRTASHSQRRSRRFSRIAARSSWPAIGS
jgi:hypothetical protein